MRRSKFQPKTQQTTFGLNITSMTDMFTLLLVFLLQTYNTNPVEIKPIDNLEMPSSNSEINPTEAVQLAISQKAVLFEGKEIVAIKDKKIESTKLDPNDASFIPDLFKELNTLAEKSQKKHDQEGRVIIQADRTLPYETLRQVMYTASMAGFPKVKLAIIAGE